MSLTIIALVVGAITLVVGVVLAIISENLGYISGIPGTILIAISIGAFIIAVGSWNVNSRASTELDRTACIKQGNEVIKYNAAEYCVKPGSQIIRTL